MGPSPPYTVFTRVQRRCIVLIVTVAGLFSALSSQIYFPVLNIPRVNRRQILQGIAPTFLGSFADQVGRRPAYSICFVIYIAANIGLALQHNYVALLLLRCLQSAGSSSTVALSAAVVADIYPKEERGSSMGVVMAGAFVGPAIGPILGGLLARYLGWRAIFWCLMILSGLFFLPFLFFFPETARNVVGNGSRPAPTWSRPFIHHLRRSRRAPVAGAETDDAMRLRRERRSRFRFLNPVQSLSIIFQPRSGILLLANGILFAAYTCVMASIPSVFHALYALDELQIGLCYISLGTGAAVASTTTGRILDAYYRVLAGKTPDNVPIEKARCVVALPMLIAGGLSTLAFAWVLDLRVHLAAPVTLMFLIGCGVTGALSCAATLLVDLHPRNPGAASASNNFVRCLLAAGSAAFVDPLLAALGSGWGFTLVALVMLATGVQLPLLALQRGRLGGLSPANN
ncbi:MFS general substrate transporter [Aspergillus steynii IBT 23096]|uniref:MFS general substrate transporter n=1 Tax=Aspergillus steynii IBT 23096 TaxID=1392250 RepID=A0A2I2GNT6_9EURO|nr:MFS general substrate transporter [Aspergillus steynii IBT 23096]PLB54542.1 MFS general substrate transporter [Aspergillus steynii IBT 23096]